MKEIRAGLKRLEEVFDGARAYARQRDADPGSPADLRWEAMRGLWPAEGGGLPLFVAASDVDQITSAVMFAAERGLRCVIVGGRDAPACAELLKKHQSAVIVRGTFTMPRRGDSPYDDGYTLPARLKAAGIPFAIGTGDDTAHERNLPYNAAMAAAHGLSTDDALAAITLWPAQLLGVADRYGSLAEGKSATLIVTDGSPLEVTTRTERAFIDGRAVDLSSKHSVLAEKYRERYRQQGERPQ
jgi:imidazolonepropionase-like amidohydrolase